MADINTGPSCPQCNRVYRYVTGNAPGGRHYERLVCDHDRTKHPVDRRRDSRQATELKPVHRTFGERDDD